MNAVELSKLAQYCRSVLPALNTAILCDLNGEKTTNLVSILGEWSNAALQTLENDTYHTDEICNLLETVFSDTFIDGVTSIEDIDNRISDAAEMIGITNPAAIETLLLRGTGILDAETYHLGKDPANEYAAGVSYALVLAHFAHKAGLTSKKVSLQDAYVKTRVGELHGHSAAIKSGAAKCGEVIEVGLPEFTSHSPDVSRYVAEALLQVMHTKSDFDALIATIDILSGNNLSLDISHDAALVVAERAYVKETLHDERTVREVLSCNMVIGCPDYFDHEICPNMNPQAVQNIAKRLNNSFLQAFPNAKPITPETHHAEVVKRLNFSRSA